MTSLSCTPVSQMCFRQSLWMTVLTTWVPQRVSLSVKTNFCVPRFLLTAKKKYNENFWKKFWLLTRCLCLWRLNYTGRRWGGFWKDSGDGNYTDWQKSVPWAWTLSWPNDATAIITSSPRDPNESRLFSDTGTSQRLCAKSSLNGNLPTFKRTLVPPENDWQLAI